MFSAYNFIKSKTQAQVFFYEFCVISKKTFFRRTPAVAASGTKLIHQMSDKLGADIVNINGKLKENVKDMGKLNQSIQMSQDTNHYKLEEIDSSVKQQKIEHMT